MTTTTLDWARLGRDLRISANDAHDGNAPGIGIAYEFLLENPECFLAADEGDAWPEWMPPTPNATITEAYYASNGPVLTLCASCDKYHVSGPCPNWGGAGAQFDPNEIPHASDCAVWVHENCDCITGKAL